MTTVVLILMILVCFNFLLKQTFVPRNVLAITTLVLGIFAALMWQVAIEQSKTQIIDWLHDTALMRNIAAILSIDVVVQLTFCIFTVRSAGSRGNTLRSRIIAKGLLFYPGFIIFPVVFALLVQLIFLTPGVSFTLVSTSLGVAILFAVPLGIMVLRAILPESDLRLEIRSCRYSGNSQWRNSKCSCQHCRHSLAYRFCRLAVHRRCHRFYVEQMARKNV